MWLSFRISLVVVMLAAFCGGAWAQNAADNRMGSPKAEDDRDIGPKSIHETLEKMRIEKEKKDHEEMIDRGDETVKISNQLEKSFEHNGRLSNEDIARLERVEKLAKKIREELGGHEDNDDDDGVGTPSLADAVKILRTSAGTLYDELKKTTRFTISAAAIQSSNTVLKLARLLKLTR